MKIVFTGGGSGGHFYPIVAVAQRVNQIIDEEKILGAKLFYFSNEPYDKQILFENNLIFQEVNAGKMRLYFSVKNFFDVFRVAIGFFRALLRLFVIYPDVVFGKGGFASFPTILAAFVLRIPVVIHESDSAPGRVNAWAGKHAHKVAVSFQEAGAFFPKNKVAWLGHPIRREIEHKAERSEALEYFKLDPELPTIMVIGGSQGAERINNVILDALPRLVEKYQIIHQTGINNFKIVKGEMEVIMGDNPLKARYHPYAFLNSLQMKMTAGVTSVVISRSGSFIFEIASWGLPSIVIPINHSNADHQRKNAFAYAKAGACSVMEESNFTANILLSELERIMTDEEVREHLSRNALNFNKKDSAYKIARELINIALSHEK